MFREKNTLLLRKSFSKMMMSDTLASMVIFPGNVCSKHRKKEQSKDAHGDYSKQSVKYKDFLNVFMAKVELLGFPSLLDYIALRCEGRGEPFLSPLCHPDLSSNAPSPSDPDDATYIEEEKNDFKKKPPAKKQKVSKSRTKVWEQK